MAMPRLDGSTSFTRTPPISSSPAVIDSSPPIRRAGPVTSICTGSNIKGIQLSSNTVTERIAAASLYTAGQAGDELTLEHEEDDERRQRRQHGREQHRAIVGGIGGEQHRDD